MSSYSTTLPACTSKKNDRLIEMDTLIYPYLLLLLCAIEYIILIEEKNVEVIKKMWGVMSKTALLLFSFPLWPKCPCFLISAHWNPLVA